MLELIKHRFVRIAQSYFPKPLNDEEFAFIRDNFNKDLQSLFFAQPLCDQRHGLLVYEKCLQVFTKSEDRPTDHELLLASCFHDVAKKDCKFSVSQRVLFATLLLAIPTKERKALLNSNSKLLRRIGIYVDHAHLSWDLIKTYVDSDFVHDATVYHHGFDEETQISLSRRKNVDIFIKADTL